MNIGIGVLDEVVVVFKQPIQCQGRGIVFLPSFTGRKSDYGRFSQARFKRLYEDVTYEKFMDFLRQW
jgi:hypothetical protein